MTNSLQKDIQKTATDHEVTKVSIRSQQQERSFLGARSAIGLMSSATKKNTARVFHTSSVEGYENELQSTSDSNIDEIDQVNMVSRGRQGNNGKGVKGNNNDNNNTKVYVCILCGLRNHTYTKSRFIQKNVGKTQCWACSGNGHTARDHFNIKVKGTLSIENKCTMCYGIFHTHQYCPNKVVAAETANFFRPQQRTRSGDLTEETSNECHPTNKLSTQNCNELVVQREIDDDNTITNASGHILPDDNVINAKGHTIPEDVIVCNASGHIVSNVGNVNICNVNEKEQVVSQVSNESERLTKAEVDRSNISRFIGGFRCFVHHYKVLLYR